MRISQDAALRFISLYTKLLYYAGQQRQVLTPDTTFDDFLDTPMMTKINCRDAIYEPSLLIDDFLTANRDALSEEEQEIVGAWKRHVKGSFIILRHLKKHTIFLGTQTPNAAYGVLGLTTDLTEIFPNWRLPLYVRTVLLPYEGVIVCDGLFATHNVIIGPNMQRDFNEEYKELKRAGRVLTTLE